MKSDEELRAHFCGIAQEHATAGDFWAFVADLTHSARDLIAGGETVEQIIAVLHGVWDSVVVPIDWKFVPDFLESRLEQSVWNAIARSIRKLAEPKT